MTTIQMTELLNTAEVSALTGIPVRTFDQYAYRGGGPTFIKLGRHRRYRPADIEAWIKANTHDGSAA